MSVIILGIDPGLRATGWGAVRADGARLSFIAAGTITTLASVSLAERLTALYNGLAAVVADIAPHEAAVENTFVNRDAVATLKLGQARGIALLAPAITGVPVSEYAPNLIKKTVVGAGHADKHQIRHMVTMLLPKTQGAVKGEHAFDALAIAICHSSHRRALKVAA